MNKAQRTVTYEVLGILLGQMARTDHELYRLAQVYGAGLSDKEKAFLVARHKALDAEHAKLAKLYQRLGKTHGAIFQP